MYGRPGATIELLHDLLPLSQCFSARNRGVPERLTAAIRRSSLDLPAGQIQTDEGALAIRSKNQAYSRDDFENIVIRNSGGAEVKLRDVATVREALLCSARLRLPASEAIPAAPVETSVTIVETSAAPVEVSATPETDATADANN